VYSVVKSGHETVGLTKLGEQKAGTHGDPTAISAEIPGGHKYGLHVMPTGQVVSTGPQGSEKHGITHAVFACGEIGTHGVHTLKPYGCGVEIAPAGNAHAIRKTLASANAIKSFTLISIPSFI
jgi:hypothetical protein